MKEDVNAYLINDEVKKLLQKATPKSEVRDAVREDEQNPPLEEHPELRTLEYESEINVCRP